MGSSVVFYVKYTRIQDGWGGAKIEYKRLQSWYKKIQHLRCSVCESPYVCELYGDNTIVLDLLHEA